MSFRELTRKKQALSEEECFAVLREEKRGVLSVLGDGGYPYGTPLNHYFDEENRILWFHCGRIGHRLDALRACGKASFCVISEEPREEGSWALRFRSVIAFGRVEIVDDPGKVVDITTKLCRKFTDDEDYIRREIAQFGKATLLLALHIEHLSGKLVKEE